jgi:hypothetical protein
MTRHGFYMGMGRLAYPYLAPMYWKQMAADGMTTGTVSEGYLLCPSDPIAGITVSIDNMLDAGLAQVGEPLLVAGEPSDIYQAKQMATREWPETIMINLDDPSPGSYDDVVYLARAANRLYFRSSLFVNGNYVKEGKRRDGGLAGILGEAVDIWIVQAHTWQEDTEKNANALGKELWAAYACPATGCYDHMRYLAGIWCWARRPRQLLVWTNCHLATTMVRPDGSLSVDPADHHSYTIPRADGTFMTTPGYDGYVQGIKDCRVLEHLESRHDPKIDEYLWKVRASCPFQMARPGKALPKLQGAEVMEELKKLQIVADGYACMGEYCETHARAKAQSMKGIS